MLCHIRPFNKVEDLKEVSQYGFVDLKLALSEGTIPSDVTMNDLDYNGIEEPDSILSRPRDVFEASRLRDRVAAAGAPADKTE